MVTKSNGKPTLKASDAKTYILVSSARALDSYVGQKVRITASGMNARDPSLGERSNSSQQAQNQPRTLDVEEIAKIPGHCGSAK